MNERIRNSLHDTVLVKCQVCSVPQVEQIYWLRDEQQITDENIHIKMEIINDQCSQSTLDIMVGLDERRRFYIVI